MDEIRKKRQTQRIGGYLKEITTFKDSSGKVLQQVVLPLMTEFRPRDLLQVIVGATILAIPISFTEEVWNLGAGLPLLNVALLSLTGLFFIAFFVYFNFYRFHFKENKFQFIIRVLCIYIFSHFVVAIILTLIQQAPWKDSFLVAIKRVMLIAFPASMSAAISDNIK